MPRTPAEIAILPTLPARLSIEDQTLERWAPAFGPWYVLPNVAFARMLSFLNVSLGDYVAAVHERYGVDVLSSAPQAQDQAGPWQWSGRHAPKWTSLSVDHVAEQPALLGFDELFEIMENASYGGQLAIGGYHDYSDDLPDGAAALKLRGRFQIGIIDYL